MVLLTELEFLPGSSSSSSTNDHRYDVFLSFRGADTRKRFTAHLYKALVEADYSTFLDDEEIETGEPLKQELEIAIESSRAAIIVLSRDYASSTWCLDELVLILEQQKKFNQLVIPIFYDVEPTDVRKQTSTFGEAMAKHTRRMEAETDEEIASQLAQKIELWKKALTQVAGLKGKDANDRFETELVEEIVNIIYTRLGEPLGTPTLPQLIGVKHHADSIISWLNNGSSHTADVLTVWGMGGIGKTSLAKYVYELHHCKCTSSFVGDISRRCAGNYRGLLDVQKQLCDDISKTSDIQVHDVSVYTFKIEKALARKKVLLVLDDVDSLDQLDALLGNKGFNPGSKIIITTKDTSLTERCALFKTNVNPKHTKCILKGLSENESLKLLCHHAFMCNRPHEGFEEVSKRLARYCEGHPLALQVLGKSLHKRDVGEWEDSIELLKKEPHSHITNVLKMSFDTLPFENDKELFKHIACFFVGFDKGLIETILNASDINTRSGITNLVDRCLLSIGRNDQLTMHSLIQEMGRNLVRQESPHRPWERSRLWCHEESFKVLEQKKGTENLIGLALDMRMLDKEMLNGSLQLKTDALNKMDNLKLLQLNHVKINGSIKDISKELRWLCMHGFHLKSIPSDLQMEKVVVLDMSHSNIESFDMSYSSAQLFVSRLKGVFGSNSKNKQLLGSLKILDLSFCEQLRSLRGFSELPVLEKLIIANCTSLIQVSESIEHCVELVFIDLSHCKKLKKLPKTIGKLKKLKTLLSNGCHLLVFPTELRNMDSLQRLEANNIGVNLQTFSSAGAEVIHREMKSFMNNLPISLVHLSLQNNNLSNKSFPMDFSSLIVLKELYLDGNPIVSMPSCVRTLPRLKLLSMGECEVLKTVACPPPTLTMLSLRSRSEMTHIDQLDLFCSQAKPRNSVSQILFHPEMSLLRLELPWYLLGNSSFEIEGVIRIRSMGDVEEKVLLSLGWTYLRSIQDQQVKTSHLIIEGLATNVQLYYEFGIFSTFYWGNEIPNWVEYRSNGSSISFTVPSSPRKLRGLNIWFLQKFKVSSMDSVPFTVIRNMTKKLTWIYDHYIPLVNVTEECLIFLSHWMFGKKEIEDGDQLTITIGKKDGNYNCMEAECGIGLVYGEGEKNEEEEEDALSYYKSWNHIIGGELITFQLTTGEYILNHYFLPRNNIESYRPFVAESARGKGVGFEFRAFSRLKSDSVSGESDVHELGGP